MNESVRVADVTIIVPPAWLDVTEALPVGGATTLARADGVGALQFSTVRYRSGVQPNLQAWDLRRLLEEFGASHGLGSPTDVTDGQGKNPFVTGDFSSPSEFIRVWYVTNGSDLAFITYVTQEHDRSLVVRELDEAAEAIASLEFP